MHDESNDGFEVVSVEGHLTLFGHVHPSGVPGATATAHPFHPLTSIGRLESVYTSRETVTWWCVCVWGGGGGRGM